MRFDLFGDFECLPGLFLLVFFIKLFTPNKDFRFAII
tara:strand:+ start:322 stop:432 length:111 start_codon:yes stop_codon:yes gene_type:complete